MTPDVVARLVAGCSQIEWPGCLRHAVHQDDHDDIGLY